jgi:uncharacterized membrane protein
VRVEVRFAIRVERQGGRRTWKARSAGLPAWLVCRFQVGPLALILSALPTMLSTEIPTMLSPPVSANAMASVVFVACLVATTMKVVEACEA